MPKLLQHWDQVEVYHLLDQHFSTNIIGPIRFYGRAEISYQIPLILKIGITRGLIVRKFFFAFIDWLKTTFGTNMRNLMNSSFHLQDIKPLVLKTEIRQILLTSSFRWINSSCAISRLLRVWGWVGFRSTKWYIRSSFNTYSNRTCNGDLFQCQIPYRSTRNHRISFGNTFGNMWFDRLMKFNQPIFGYCR